MSENLTLSEKISKLLEEMLFADNINDITGDDTSHLVKNAINNLEMNAIIIFGDTNETKVFTAGNNLKQTLIHALEENEPLNDLFATTVLHFAKDIPELSIDQPSLFDNRIKNIFHDIPIDFKP